MERLIKKITSNIHIVFDNGKFDEWCVYIKINEHKKAPRDIEYFEFFRNLGKKYSREKVFNHFLKIYNKVSDKIDNRVTDMIINFAKSEYENKDSMSVAINFIVIYSGMVAERNKKYTVLKERIKRLGMYQLLILDLEPNHAANFSKGKKATELSRICRNYGF